MALPGFNIQQFISNLNQTGIQKTNKFLVRFPAPNGLVRPGQDQTWVNTARTLEFWCEIASLPGVALSTHSLLRYGYGVMEKKPFAPLFSDITFTFIVDAGGNIFNYFQQWMNMINNYDTRNGVVPARPTSTAGNIPIAPYVVAYKIDYLVDINIVAYDDSGKPTNSVVLREAYPTFLGDQQLNWGDNNNFAKLPIMFTYLDWYNESIPV